MGRFRTEAHPQRMPVETFAAELRSARDDRRALVSEAQEMFLSQDAAIVYARTALSNGSESMSIQELRLAELESQFRRPGAMLRRRVRRFVQKRTRSGSLISCWPDAADV